MPLLDECRSWFVGGILERIVLGDHVGFLLEPIAAAHDDQSSPLLFFSDVAALSRGHAP